MKIEKKHFFLVLYILFFLLEITGELFENTWLTFVFKPLLMPALFLISFFQERNREPLIILALFFSFLGDSFLLFSQQNEIYFLLGLGSFLIAQSSYVFTFLKDKKDGMFPAKNIFPVVLFFLLGLAALFYFILPTLGEFTVPVIVYASIVAFMGVSAVLRYRSVSFNSYIKTLFGAFLFIISDTFIALDKFLYNENLTYASVFIMTLYIAGQYLIIKGRNIIY